MLAKVFVYALLPIAAINAAPTIPKRGLLDDVKSAWSVATSDVASAVHGVETGYHLGVLEASATQIYDSLTSELGTATTKVFATVTTISSVPVVEVTSVGGGAITIATSGASSTMTTSFAGHTFVVPSVSATSSHNAAVGSSSLSLSKPMLVSAATILGGIFTGALFVL
ncbi:uncharacterized protein FIBRA_00545 [Fibroporia radiculosa]|uniref:Uncharacterized protein n=1 Tax=Fibroporia radiculosa TaxID=599839 RepID=J4GI15_9APHY|nr:uncharacterized protein FIBRA_00545 [Fibroporia radiculosa]CCL98545.1 predicted protein [Fibroporia radiculosa]